VRKGTISDVDGETAGVRTFLIADVRGYTRYSDEQGDEAASALARRFAEIARDAVATRGGELIELRGDEALCVFASARSAVRGAVELQRRARERVDGGPALPLAVGIGLDAGEAVPTEGGYRGRALNVAARLCSLAKGGEILASETVAHLAGRHDEAEFAPRRPAAVKGVAEPLRFVEVVPKVELPPPPLRTRAPKPPRARRIRALLIGAGVLLAAAVALAVIELSNDSQATPGFRPLASKRCSPLYYRGAGSPQLLVAADLPRQPGILGTTTPMLNGMTLALERHGYTAGPYRVGLQVCDDATPSSPGFDGKICSANAQQYVDSPSVIGVVGPFSSGCATSEIPVLDRAKGGPLPIVGASTTYVGLTRPVSSSDSTEPGAYYPTGRRNFARVLPPDDVQAAGDAIVAERLHVKRVYVLDDGSPPSRAFADYFVRAARRLGIAVAGRASWDAAARNYAPLAGAIARRNADGVFLAVSSVPNSVRLLRTLRARLGRAVQFMAPDPFDPESAVLAGSAADGMTFSVPGPAIDRLARTGRQFVASFSKRFGPEPTRFAVAAAQAMDVLLDAIAHSDGSRASATSNLFKVSVSNGILGSFSITPTGDTTLDAVAIYRIAGGKVTTFATVVVPDALVAP
jgi:branched-chain amino acid transport system substrate-binding protein